MLKKTNYCYYLKSDVEEEKKKKMKMKKEEIGVVGYGAHRFLHFSSFFFFLFFCSATDPFLISSHLISSHIETSSGSDNIRTKIAIVSFLAWHSNDQSQTFHFFYFFFCIFFEIKEPSDCHFTSPNIMWVWVPATFGADFGYPLILTPGFGFWFVKN